MDKFKKLYAELEKRMDENLEVARRCPKAGYDHRAVEDNDILALMDRMIEEEREKVLTLVTLLEDSSFLNLL